jgi:hypothetical protein
MDSTIYDLRFLVSGFLFLSNVEDKTALIIARTQPNQEAIFYITYQVAHRETQQ